MKIVDRKTFLALPPNTLFSKYQPCCFGELHIKGETQGEDFLKQAIADAIECGGSDEFFDVLLSAPGSGVSMTMDFRCESRDGLFDQGELFAVWEAADIRDLLGRFRDCLRMACAREGYCACEPNMGSGTCAACHRPILQL